jgi:hypothetical protein
MTNTTSKSKSVKKASAVDATVMNPYIKRINTMVDELHLAQRKTLDLAINLGGAMVEAKAVCMKELGHGHWEKWADKNIHYKKAQRNRLMKLASNQKLLPRKTTKAGKQLSIADALTAINTKIAEVKQKEAEEEGDKKPVVQEQDKRKDRGKLTINQRLRKQANDLRTEIERCAEACLEIDQETMSALQAVRGAVNALEALRNKAVLDKAA